MANGGPDDRFARQLCPEPATAGRPVYVLRSPREFHPDFSISDGRVHVEHDAVLYRIPVPRPGPHEPAGRRVHQRASASQPHPAEDRGNGRGRRAPVRHIPSAQGVARLRVQDPQPVPGDGQHPAGRDRRQQAQGGHAGRGATHRRVQESQPGHVQLGNTRQTREGRHLRQEHGAVHQFHQQASARRPEGRAEEPFDRRDLGSEQRRRFGHGIRAGLPSETETAPEPDHVHGRAAGRLGARVPQVAVSGRVHQRGVGPKDQADGGPGASVVQQPSGASPQTDGHAPAHERRGGRFQPRGRGEPLRGLVPVAVRPEPTRRRPRPVRRPRAPSSPSVRLRLATRNFARRVAVHHRGILSSDDMQLRVRRRRVRGPRHVPPSSPSSAPAPAGQRHVLPAAGHVGRRPSPFARMAQARQRRGRGRRHMDTGQLLVLRRRQHNNSRRRRRRRRRHVRRRGHQLGTALGQRSQVRLSVLRATVSDGRDVRQGTLETLKKK